MTAAGLVLLSEGPLVPVKIGCSAGLCLGLASSAMPIVTPCFVRDGGGEPFGGVVGCAAVRGTIGNAEG